MSNKFEDKENRYTNQNDKSQTDQLLELINSNSRARAAKNNTVKQAVKVNEKSSAIKSEEPKVSQADLFMQNIQNSESAYTPAQNISDGAKRIERLKKEQERKKLKRKKTIQGIALGLGSFLIIVVLGFVGIAAYFLNGLKINDIDEDNLAVNEQLHETLEQTNPNLTKITNIALFGIDAREGDTDSRSDAIMIMSINPITNKIKLISVMRDSYVDMDGVGWDKLTHAYYYGGPELTIRTLNVNFGLNITDYVTVDFGSMAEAIDAIGGVYVDVDEDEMYHINKNVREINKNYTPLEETGYILLNGERAVGYARIRAIDSDQARTGRQREVVMAAFERVKDMDITRLPNLAKTIIPMIETSMSYSEIISFIPMLSNEIVMEQTLIPGTYDGAYDAYIDGVYYLGYDLDSATQHIYDFIYNDIHPETDPDELETDGDTYTE